MPNYAYPRFAPTRQNGPAIDGQGIRTNSEPMKAAVTAIIAEAPEGGYWAICPEVPGANGQGDTIAAAKKNLRDAIRLISADRLEDARRSPGKKSIQTIIAV